MGKQLTAKQQAYLDSLADDDDAPEGEEDEVNEVEYRGKRYQLVTDAPDDDDAPKPVRRPRKTAATTEPAPPAKRRFLT